MCNIEKWSYTWSILGASIVGGGVEATAVTAKTQKIQILDSFCMVQNFVTTSWSDSCGCCTKHSYFRYVAASLLQPKGGGVTHEGSLSPGVWLCVVCMTHLSSQAHLMFLLGQVVFFVCVRSSPRTSIGAQHLNHVTAGKRDGPKVGKGGGVEDSHTMQQANIALAYTHTHTISRTAGRDKLWEMKNERVLDDPVNTLMCPSFIVPTVNKHISTLISWLWPLTYNVSVTTGEKGVKLHVHNKSHLKMLTILMFHFRWQQIWLRSKLVLPAVGSTGCHWTHRARLPVYGSLWWMPTSK